MLDKIKAKRHAKALKAFGLKKVKEVADKEVHKHEKAKHEGPMTKLKHGGEMPSLKSHKRIDKLARGGKHGTKVNVIVAPQGGQRPPMPQAMPQRPMPAPTGAPMAGPGMPPPGMKRGGKMAEGGKPGGGLTTLPKEPTDEPDTMPDKKKRGGTQKCATGGKMTAGAMSGEGRLQKIKNLPARLRSKKGI